MCATGSVGVYEMRALPVAGAWASWWCDAARAFRRRSRPGLAGRPRRARWARSLCAAKSAAPAPQSSAEWRALANPACATDPATRPRPARQASASTPMRQVLVYICEFELYSIHTRILVHVQSYCPYTRTLAYCYCTRIGVRVELSFIQIICYKSTYSRVS